MLPESLIRSCSIILGAEAADQLKQQLEKESIRIPSEATISRFRLKLDVSCPVDYLEFPVTDTVTFQLFIPQV